MKQSLIAFWRHDTFPYCLWGEVIRIGNDGAITASNYGGRRFMPIRILPASEGRKIANKLQALRDEYEHQVRTLRETSRIEVEKIAPFIKREKT